MPPRPARPILLVLALLAVAACAPIPDFPIVQPSAAVATPGTPQAARWVEIDVASARDSSVLVTGGSLFSPYFERLDAVAVGVPVDPGGSAPVRLPLGAAACPAGAGPSSAQLVIEVDGTEVVQSVMLDDAVLAEINADECRVQDATDAAEPTLGPSGGVDGDVVHTSIVLTRGYSLLPVSLDAVAGTELLSLTAADGELPAVLPTGRERLEVPVDVRVETCDRDAFAASGDPFVFEVTLTVEGGTPTRVWLRAEGPLRDDLLALVGGCGTATPGP